MSAILSRIRGHLEGLDYLFHRNSGLASACPAYDHLRRRKGLAPYRKVWWQQSKLESYACLRHYAFLLDWAVGTMGDGRKTKDNGQKPMDDRQWAIGDGSKSKPIRPDQENTFPLTFNLQPLTFNVPPHARVIILRMGHLGDILHLMPTVREIRRQRPGWTLELITGPWSKALAESFGVFDKVHDYCPDVVQYHRGDRTQVRTVADEKVFIRKLRNSGVDLVFCPSAPHFCELPLVVGLGAEGYVGEPWPLDDPPRPPVYITKPFDSRQYEMDAVADFLPLMGLERTRVSLYYLVADALKRKTANLLAQLCNAAGNKSKAVAHGSQTSPSTFNLEPSTCLRKHSRVPATLVLLFPGSGWPGKNWPPEAFAQLADDMIKVHNVTVCLAGSPGEYELCEKVRLHMLKSAHNLAGQFSLADTAALIAQSAGVIGNDSAPIHLAAALKVPTVSLWGPTFPEKWAPQGPDHTAVKASEPCAGCLYWHVNASCRQDPGCIASVRYEEVVEAVRRVLG